MKLLVVDKTSEGQTTLAKLFESFDGYDQDTLDLSVNLTSERDLFERLPKAEVLVIGSGLADEARGIALQARSIVSDIQILMFVSNEAYSSGVFRIAHVAGVRKVLPDNSTPLFVLQELVSIHEEFRATGRVKNGKLTVFAQAKGGVGVTSLCAALAEVCNAKSRHTLLWDYDLQTRDLCRALTVGGIQGRSIDNWLEEGVEISRQDFRNCVHPIAEHVSVLTPPESLGARDIMSGIDGCGVISRMIDLARLGSDNIIVDLAGHLGPGAQTILRAADSVVVVIDDSVLGLSAAQSLLGELKSILKSTDSIRFLCSGVKLSVEEIAAQVGHGYRLMSWAFELPVVPFDPAAARWPGRGKTLYSEGKPATKQFLEQIAGTLGLIDPEQNLRVSSSDGRGKIVSMRNREIPGERDFIRHFLQRVGNF